MALLPPLAPVPALTPPACAAAAGPAGGAHPALRPPAVAALAPTVVGLVRRLPMLLVCLALCLAALIAAPAWASLDDDRYDGNIFALYAGNGSLVPPRSSLAQSLAEGRVAVVIYYLDDSAVSKRFAPVVSELQRQWGNSIDLIPLVTDPLQDRPVQGQGDPARYWKGSIPQVVVFDRDGAVSFDASGAVAIEAINAAISRATGIALPAESAAAATLSFNELNREVVSPQP